MNPFIYTQDDYDRNINLLNNYIDQQCFYLAKMTGKDEAIIKPWLIEKMKNDPSLGVKDPKVKYLSREKQQDRVKAMSTLSEYVGMVAKNDFPMAPTMTVYLPAHIQESLYSKYIKRKKKERSIHKKRMFKATMEGDIDTARSENNIQQSKKIAINSLSGAALMRYSISFTASLHPTLTSTCRISTSYANANNEKFMGGNRPYYTDKVTLDNLNLLAMSAKHDKISSVMTHFGIKAPSVTETLAVIRYSTDHYWSRFRPMDDIERFLMTCTPIELANICYNGDLYHLAQLNPTVVKTLITDFVDFKPGREPNAAHYLEEKADVHTVAYVSYLCSELLAGRQLSKVKKDDLPVYEAIGDVCRHTFEMLERYKELIETFLRPDFLTPEAYEIEQTIRRVVITSDTDSTIFTTQHWTHFVTGSYNFEPLSYKVGYFMAFVSSQMTVHLLKMMSRNIGLSGENLDKISMKSEYYFPAYTITPSAKHYYAFISAREGNVYSEFDLEVKGVGLRNSKIPSRVMERFNTQLVNTLRSVIENGELHLADIIEEPYVVERMVADSLKAGRPEYLMYQQLKPADSYSLKEAAPNYQYHVLWQEVFAPKYGDAPELPYTAIKVSTNTTNRSALKAWVDSIEDRALAERLSRYIAMNDKTDMKTFQIPAILFTETTIPQELLMVLDIPRLLRGIMGPWYLYLESMGFYFANDKNTRMISTEFANFYPEGIKDIAEAMPEDSQEVV